MKILLYLFLLSFCITKSQEPSFGNKEIDSLISVTKTVPNDTNLVNTYKLISRKLFNINTETGIKYGEKSLNLAKELKWEEGIANAKEVLAINYSVRFEYEKSNKYLFEALEYYESVNNLKKVGNIYTTLSINQTNTLNTSQALSYIDSSISKYKQINYVEGLVMSYANYAITLQQMSKYYEAIETYFTILELIDKHNIEERRVEVTSNIGNTYFHIGNYSQAEKYYKITIDLMADETVHKASVYNNLAEVLVFRNELDEALEYLEQALSLNRQIGNMRFVSMNLANIGNIYLKKKEFQKAYSLLIESLDMANNLNSIENQMLINSLLGSFYITVFLDSDKLKNENNLVKSIKYYELSKSLATEYNDQRRLIDISKDLSNAYKISKDYKKAYQNLELHYELKDSILNIETKSKIKVLENDKERKLKNAEIEYLKNENQYKSQLNILLIISVLSIIGILFFVYYNYRNKNKQNKLLEEKVNSRTKDLDEANKNIKNALEKQTELNKLKSNMISNVSHQFRTPLTSISSYVQIIELKSKENTEFEKPILRIKNSIKDLVVLIDKISTFQNINDIKEKVELEQINLNDIVTNAIDKIKSNTKLIYNFETNLNVLEFRSNSKLLSDTIELIIENAVKFSKPGTKINISSFKDNNLIYLNIADEGKGIPESEIEMIFDPFFVGAKNVALSTGNGLGLSIAKNNITLLNGDIKIESRENIGTTVSLIFKTT